MLKLEQDYEYLHLNNAADRKPIYVCCKRKRRTKFYSITAQDKGTDYLKVEGYRKDFVSYKKLQNEKVFRQT